MNLAPTKWGRWRERWFLLTVIVDAVGSGVWMPFGIIFFTRALDFTLETTGLAMTCGALIGLLVGFRVGHLVDRFGPGTVAVGSNVLRAGSFAFYPFVSNFWELALAVAVTACADRMFWTANAPMLSLVFKGKRLDHVLATAGVAGIVGLGVGALLGSLFAESPAGLNGLAWANSGTFLFAAIALALILRDRLLIRPAGDAAGDRRIGASTVWSNRAFLSLCLTQVLMVLASSSFVIILPVAVLSTTDAPAWVPAASIVVGNIAIALAQKPAVWLSSRTSRARVIKIGIALLVAALLLLIPMQVLPLSAVIPVLFVSVVLAGAAEAAIGALMVAAANDAAPENERGRYSAVFQTSWGLAEVIAPLIFTALLAWSSFALWGLLAAVAVIAMPLLVITARWLPGVLTSRTVNGNPSEATPGSGDLTHARDE